MMLHIKVARVWLALAAVLVVLIVVILLNSWLEESPPQPPPENRLARDLRAGCRLLLRQPLEGASPRTNERLAWACGRLGVLLPWPRKYGCGRSVTYSTTDGLEQNLLRYSVLFGFSRLLRADALVEPDMLSSLLPVFPRLSLPQLPPPPAAESWQPVPLPPALELARCRPEEQPGDSEPRRYLISGQPDGSALHLFHPFERELRQELRFSDALQRRAESVLQAARGRRASATFIGLLLPTPDGRRHAFSDLYLQQSLDQYRRRFHDALFIVVASNTTALPPSVSGDDVVRLEQAVVQEPTLSLAVRAACNHSIVTGDEGFWGGYLAGGNMTVPQPERSDAQGFGWLFLHSQFAVDERWTIVK